MNFGLNWLEAFVCRIIYNFKYYAHQIQCLVLCYLLFNKLVSLQTILIYPCVNILRYICYQFGKKDTC